ncbi:MAG: cytochrome c family protein [Lentisphaerae bacterium]|nr:cytochrome c family protein [Lentisphaerota bacterium]
MGQIFHPSANTLAKLGIFGGVFLLIGLFTIWDQFLRSPYVTGVRQPIEQTVPFSHKHHVQQLGIDCRYCHTAVEKSAVAGIPPTKTCMNCHVQIWKDAPILAPVRDSFLTGKQLQWTRVHDLPDFVYFNHSIHVNRGIGCVSCHGQVDEMPLMWKANTLHMSWCLNCHRHPDKFVRPKDKVFDMRWERPTGTNDPGKALVAEYDIQSLTSCSICHR